MSRNRCMKTILLLEHHDERIAEFRQATAALGAEFELKVWRDAPSMIAECEAFFPSAALISLADNLNPAPGGNSDGLAAARFLGDFLPVCPVLIHASNTDRAWSMHNELRFAGWIAELVGAAEAGWIEKRWLSHGRELLATHPNLWSTNLPADHATRIERLKLSLDGLGLGDALGEMLAYRAETGSRRLAEKDLPAGPWFHTDDTEMAISICTVLKSHGFVHQDALAKRFARRFERDPDRGYGKITRIQLREIMAGAKWNNTAANAFGGQGSMGNGGAMRVAPLGAYFAEDLEACISEARASAAVTHTHPEGIAGAIAVAVAAAMAWRLRNVAPAERPRKFFDEVLRLTPESQVRRGILVASQTPRETPVEIAVKTLGNGSLITAPDTVPFCLWSAAHHLDNFIKALAETIRVGGDCDTNAAIVGGIVALSAGRDALPREWLRSREPISI
jgi:ADP-ribosylglycohydrolase